MGRHEPALSPITASESYPYTEADLEFDRVYDGQVEGDCETLDPDVVQEIPLSEWDAYFAAEEAAARYHHDQGRQAWAAVSHRVLEICGDHDDVGVFLSMKPCDWPGEDLLFAFAEVAAAMPAKWRIGSLWMIQIFVQDYPPGGDYCLAAYAQVMAAVAELATRIDGELIAQPANVRGVANGR